jgi:hypothetical protein
MKKVLLTDIIDETTIAIGIDRWNCDPVQTEKNIVGLLEETKEFKAQEVRKKRAASLVREMGTIQKNVALVVQNVAKRHEVTISEAAAKRELFTSKERERLNSADSAYARMNADLQAERKELATLADPVKKAKREIIRKNAVYPDLPENRSEISEKDVADFMPLFRERDLKNKDRENQRNKIRFFVTVDKRLIPDLRGRKYYFPGSWKAFSVERLDEQVDDSAIFEHELSAEQLKELREFEESQRVAGLTDEEKQSEIDIAKKTLLAQARVMRENAEIERSTASAALKESKAWYAEQLAALNDKYGM